LPGTSSTSSSKASSRRFAVGVGVGTAAGGTGGNGDDGLAGPASGDAGAGGLPVATDALPTTRASTDIVSAPGGATAAGDTEPATLAGAPGFGGTAPASTGASATPPDTASGDGPGAGGGEGVGGAVVATGDGAALEGDGVAVAGLPRPTPSGARRSAMATPMLAAMTTAAATGQIPHRARESTAETSSGAT
jgi:hypothetical protein